MTTETTTFQGVAEEFARAFEYAYRDENDRETGYVRLRDEYRDTWAQEIVFSAHGDTFPDDWRYACIRNAADAIAECDSEDEANDRSGEFADGEVDVYNGARLEWLGSNLSRAGYCDDAVSEFGGEDRDTFDRIGLGQYYEASEVFGLVLRGIVKRYEAESE